MIKKEVFKIEYLDDFKLQVTHWLKRFDVFCMLNSNIENYPPHSYSHSKYDFIVGAGDKQIYSPTNGYTIDSFSSEHENSKNWKFGFLSYDLKNEFENLTSSNTDKLNWPEFYFFSPKVLLLFNNNMVTIQVEEYLTKQPAEIFHEILNTNITRLNNHKAQIKPRLSKTDYIKNVERLKKHILRGDIYEINYCQEFYTYFEFEPFDAYSMLNRISPTPFSAFFRLNDKYLLSASPERFMKKTGDTLISQPIKGTLERKNHSIALDSEINVLKHDVKEKAENIMIVDLVRNDLSKIAKKNSVKVEELCGVYTFKQVHQMISTVSCKLNTHSFADILRATFPMGSMTGAPKIKALKLAEQYETTKRGLYSGSIGYFSPDNDFDFNVVIRSLQYNSTNKYLSYMVGGAITFLSDAKKEYEECLIKASPINKLLTQNNENDR